MSDGRRLISCTLYFFLCLCPYVAVIAWRQATLQHVDKVSAVTVIGLSDNYANEVASFPPFSCVVVGPYSETV